MVEVPGQPLFRVWHPSPTPQTLNPYAPCSCPSPPHSADTYVKPDPDDVLRDPGMCEDFNSMCAKWESEGECNKNPGFMVRGGATRTRGSW